MDSAFSIGPVIAFGAVNGRQQLYALVVTDHFRGDAGLFSRVADCGRHNGLPHVENTENFTRLSGLSGWYPQIERGVLARRLQHHVLPASSGVAVTRWKRR